MDHLVLVVHGIGGQGPEDYFPLAAAVEKMQKVFDSVGMDVPGSRRVVVDWVEWHSRLHHKHGVAKKMGKITPAEGKGVSKLRGFVNDTFMDILLFTSTQYNQIVIREVVDMLNAKYDDYVAKYPNWDRSVTIYAHSLGSIIMYDVLNHQPGKRPHFGHSYCPDSDVDSDAEAVRAHDGDDDDDGDETDDEERARDPVTGFTYPRLAFTPQNVFFLGSPVAVFLTIRAEAFRWPPGVEHVYNLYHPYDIVAYRFEPLLDPLYQRVNPKRVERHQGSMWPAELRVHVERMKEKMRESIDTFQERVAAAYMPSDDPDAFARALAAAERAGQTTATDDEDNGSFDVIATLQSFFAPNARSYDRVFTLPAPAPQSPALGGAHTAPQLPLSPQAPVPAAQSSGPSVHTGVGIGATGDGRPSPAYHGGGTPTAFEFGAHTQPARKPATPTLDAAANAHRGSTLAAFTRLIPTPTAASKRAQAAAAVVPKSDAVQDTLQTFRRQSLQWFSALKEKPLPSLFSPKPKAAPATVPATVPPVAAKAVVEAKALDGELSDVEEQIEDIVKRFQGELSKLFEEDDVVDAERGWSMVEEVIAERAEGEPVALASASASSAAPVAREAPAPLANKFNASLNKLVAFFRKEDAEAAAAAADPTADDTGADQDAAGGEAEEPVSTPLPSKEEVAAAKERVALAKIDERFGGKRVDFALMPTPVETLQEYIFAVKSHVSYWGNRDCAAFIHKVVAGHTMQTPGPEPAAPHVGGARSGGGVTLGTPSPAPQ